MEYMFSNYYISAALQTSGIIPGKITLKNTIIFLLLDAGNLSISCWSSELKKHQTLALLC